jgi:hypothetical protein
MSIQDKIREFNKSLLDDEDICDIVRYVKEINKLYGGLINLTFMNELLNYVNEDTCCIPHELLVKYKVFSNNDNLSSNVKTLIDQYDFIEHKEYLIFNIQIQHPSGIKHKINYVFHPDAFKICLIRSKNTKVYANYYILLERSIKYYNDYQIQYKNNQIQYKDNQIQNEKNKNFQISSLLKKRDEQIVESNTKINIILEDNTKIKSILDNIVNRLKSLSPTLDNIKLSNKFIIIKNDNNSYTVIRSQDKFVNKLIKNKNIINCIENENIPNAIYLWNAVKNELTKEKKIVCNYNTFAINENTFSETEFIQLIKDIFDKWMEYKN